MGLFAVILFAVPWLVGASRFSLFVATLLIVDVITILWLGPIHRPKGGKKIATIPALALCAIST